MATNNQPAANNAAVFANMGRELDESIEKIQKNNGTKRARDQDPDPGNDSLAPAWQRRRLDYGSKADQKRLYKAHEGSRMAPAGPRGKKTGSGSGNGITTTGNDNTGNDTGDEKTSGKKTARDQDPETSNDILAPASQQRRLDVRALENSDVGYSGRIIYDKGYPEESNFIVHTGNGARSARVQGTDRVAKLVDGFVQQELRRNNGRTDVGEYQITLIPVTNAHRRQILKSATPAP
ncbi:hypothetical protein PG987_016670 [Apiospora arundinis]